MGQVQSISAPSTKARWNAEQIVSYMEAHPSRAYFAHLFSKGGFRKGVEVGVADGRFSEHMLITGRPAVWRMVEPFPNESKYALTCLTSQVRLHDFASGACSLLIVREL